MDDSVVVLYNGEPVSVPKEVAEFLEQERKREQAQDKRDERHLSRSEFETVLSCLGNTDPPVEETRCCPALETPILPWKKLPAPPPRGTVPHGNRPPEQADS